MICLAFNHSRVITFAYCYRLFFSINWHFGKAECYLSRSYRGLDFEGRRPFLLFRILLSVVTNMCWIINNSVADEVFVISWIIMHCGHTWHDCLWHWYDCCTHVICKQMMSQALISKIQCIWPIRRDSEFNVHCIIILKSWIYYDFKIQKKKKIQKGRFLVKFHSRKCLCFWR